MTITEILDRRPLSRYQVRIFLLCGLVLILDGFDTQSIGFLAPSMAESLHLSVKTFGPVFAAALVGLMISSMVAGPIADRVGRKWPIIVATFTFATFALLTPWATSLNQLIAVRFLTGLGLGGAMPNVVALASEYAPKRLQHVLVTMIFCGMPFGSLLGGLVSSVLLPIWGWRSVFYAGGILPLIVAVTLIKVLPESILFLGTTETDQNEVAKILVRISPELADIPVDYPLPHSSGNKGVPVVQLFSEGRAIGTLLLWVPFFMNLLILYFIISWLPALLRQTHMPVSAGIIAISVFSFGGMVGSLGQGRLTNTWGGFALLLFEFAVSLLLIGSLAFIASFLFMVIVTFLLGCLVQGAQAGLNSLAASYYPTSIRSTGIGWALGIGRLGSIVGPIFGGIMMSRGWSPEQIFLAGTMPAFVAASAVLASRFLRDDMTAFQSRVKALE